MVYYLLKKISVPKQDTEAALLVYIIKSLQKHVKILKNTQDNSKTAHMVPQKILKLIYKQLLKIDFTSSSSLSKNITVYDRTLQELTIQMRELIPKHSEVSTEKDILKLINSSYVSTYADFSRHIKYLNPTLMNSLLRTEDTSVDQKIKYLGKAFQELLSQMLDTESNKLIEACGTDIGHSVSS